MRLLNIHTFKLEEFSSDEKPCYAILSHTWGEEEVQYRDLHDDDEISMVRKKKGYSKILQVSCMAEQQSLDYMWIDTCCINKESSAELSEAINSMFKWYKNAAVCYAYLSDCEIAESDQDGQILGAFSSSRWFERGWTLQELLAPEIVEFFDSSWRFIGRKGSGFLLHALSSATGIPELVLTQGEKLWDVAVAQRMSWAAGRRTTRPEDMAYCLMGLFDVSMPVLYGEGWRAFLRLQEEIIKSTTDTSIFAWTSQNILGPRGFLAESPNEFFAFRNHDLIVPPFRGGFEMYITNQGLRINGCWLLHCGPDIILSLTGTSETCAGTGVGIRITDSCGIFVRTWPDMAVPIDKVTGRSSATYANIFAVISSPILPSSKSRPPYASSEQPEFTEHTPTCNRLFPWRYGTACLNDQHNSTDIDDISEHDSNGLCMTVDSESLYAGHSGTNHSYSSLGQISWFSGCGTLSPSNASIGLYVESPEIGPWNVQWEILSDFDYRVESVSLAADHPFCEVRVELIEVALAHFHAWVMEDQKFVGSWLTRRSMSQVIETQLPPVIPSPVHKPYGFDGKTAGSRLKHVLYPQMSCPFYKRDKSKHYGCLRESELTTISDVIQHIWGAHKQLPYCPVCFMTFTDLLERNEHIISRSCSAKEPRRMEGVPAEQLHELYAVLTTPSSDKDQWYQIWKLIFPSESQPFSIYNDNELELLISVLRLYWKDNGREIIGSFLGGRGLLDWKLANEEQDLNTMYSMILYELIDRQLSHPANLTLLDAFRRNVLQEKPSPVTQLRRACSVCAGRRVSSSYFHRHYGRKTCLSPSRRSNNYSRKSAKCGRHSRDPPSTFSHRKISPLHCRMAHTC